MLTLISDSSNSQTAAASAPVSARPTAVLERSKLPYQVDQQVELLHLQADVEALLQQLQALKQRKLVTASKAE